MPLALISRRERWGLTLRGWFVLLALGALTALVTVFTIHPFLAVTSRTPAEYLAVEGWIHDYAIVAAKDEFTVGRYGAVIATGGPVTGLGGYRNDYGTAASLGAQRLKREGVPEAKVHLAPSRTSLRDRTYSSAVALRDWFHSHKIAVKALNVVTEDVHARRTRLLFQQAFGPDVVVGVISVPNPDYDARGWWRYSEGVRDVLGETISYLYARFLFFPPASPPNDARSPNET
ncbi:MAG: ElyC/SanA/YdcF family protein [Verrucomicrobiota bacterium]